MVIQWSEEDKVFMVVLPEFENAKAHGETYERALKEGKDLIESFIMWYQQDGRTLPPPRYFDFASLDEERSAGGLVEAGSR
jgi:predicted RNase H-like HicB family nuclease